MSEIVLRSAVERLQSLLLTETAPLNRSAKADLNIILKKLHSMQVLLKGKNRANEIENRVRQIEELNYQIEDVIESSEEADGIKILWLRKQRLSFTIKKIKSEMETIIKQIEDIKSLNTSAPLPDQITDIIGLQQDLKRVRQLMLCDASSSSSSSHIGVPVIPIYGVVGSGKTALAKLVYDDADIAKRFEIRKWIDVPYEFEIRYVLEKIMELGDGWMSHSTSEKQWLDILHSKRSLIVLDDVRSIEAWETLCRALPKLNPGSHVLVTTRVRSIAEYISRKQFHSVHNMTPLNEVDSLALFNRVLSHKDPPEREIMITEMVRCCDGSPQLIKYIALYLRIKNNNQEWKMMHQNTRAFLSEFRCPVYNELPDHLQPCFMYLGHFLEDQSIDPEKLSHLWMIEGLLSTRQSVKGESMMDMTDRYLKELARMGMVEVQAEEVPATKKLFKACRFVQGMEKFCVSNCEEKSFLKIIDLRQEDCSLSSSDGPRRLVIYLGKHKVDIPPKVSKIIRSLRVVHNGLVSPTKMLNLKEFGVLRVLDFDGIDFRRLKLLTGISNLQFLRYLSFKGCILDQLPSSISKLSYLQVFDLRVKGVYEIKIPNLLWKLRRLNHLYLPLKFATQNGEKLQLDSLTALETLVNFNTRLCRANDVSTLCKLRYLEAKIEENFSDFESINSYMKTSTSNNYPLQCSIDVIDLDCYSKERRTVLLELLRCKVLRTLQFKGFIGRLPPCDEISPNLTQLVLNKSCLKEDSMPILEKLPSLGILVLSDDAYIGKEMVCSASGFPQLKCLRLLNLSMLQRIEVENTAMPILSEREIKNCQKLDINNIPTLPRSAA